MQPYYTYTEDTTGAEFADIVGQDSGAAGIAIAGRTVTCSAFPFLLGALGSVNNGGGPATPFQNTLIGNIAGSALAPTDPTPLAAIPEFSFQIEIAGSGRFWTNRALPAASFYGEYNPLRVSKAGLSVQTVAVHCTPETSVPVGGRVHGIPRIPIQYVNIGQALGY